MASLNKASTASIHVFGCDTVTGGNLTIASEWDTKGFTECMILLVGGTIGTAGVTVATLHASDSASFSPGSGNKVAELTGTNLLLDADDNTACAWVFDPRDHGRYYDAIITAGAQACDLCLIGIGFTKGESPNSVAERGIKAAFALA